MRQIIPGLWQGNLSDLNLLGVPELREKYGFTLAVNVGSTPWVPRSVPTIYLPMFDISDEDDPERSRNNWELISDALLATTGEISRGGKVLVVCNMGISRSVIFAAMAVSVLEGIPMMVPDPRVRMSGLDLLGIDPGPIVVNDELVQALRTPGELEPSYALWKDAARAIQSIRETIKGLGGNL